MPVQKCVLFLLIWAGATLIIDHILKNYVVEVNVKQTFGRL